MKSLRINNDLRKVKILKGKQKMWIVLMIIFVLLSACSTKEDQQDYTLDTKIGQMLMFGFRGKEVNEEWVQAIHSQISQYHLGGILVLGYNVRSPQQTDSLMTFLHSAPQQFPVLFAIDQEGGLVQRLSKSKGFTGFPSAQKVADSLSVEEAYEMYRDLAKECKDYGFNYILAPVVDVNVNPESPAIGALGRSFSSNPAIVSSYAGAFIQAIEKEGLLSCLKHFPGHGSANTDSHQGLTDVTQTWQPYELDPYTTLIGQGLARSIMSAHIYHAGVDSIYPASLSYQHIQMKLRTEMNYNGVVISDDLQMGAINNYYTLEQIVIQAIKSGSDILIFSQYFNPDQNLPAQVINIIKNAITSGEISEERINQSFNRIIKMKQRIKS